LRLLLVFAVAFACPLPHSQMPVISTEAARALCEQRSGEIRFSATTFPSLAPLPFPQQLKNVNAV